MQNSKHTHNSYIKQRADKNINLRSVNLKNQPKLMGNQAQITKKVSKPSKAKYVFRYILTSSLIFVITTIFMNFHAYSSILYQSYLDVTGQTKNLSLLEYSSQAPDKLTERKQELESNQKHISHKLNLPIFNSDIIPPGYRIIIPRLGTNVPIKPVTENNLFKQNWFGLEKDIQAALLDGVVHYPGTPTPNKSGNVVLTGHSSYYPWNPGRYKDVFAVLHNINIGDEIVMFHKQKKYSYTVTQIEKIYPEDVKVLGDAGDDRLTLITCTPIGTNIKRLIVTAKPSEAI